MGSRELYDYIDDNPGLASYSVDYTNNPAVIAQIDDFVSINACIEVDLFGQVCAETSWNQTYQRHRRLAGFLSKVPINLKMGKVLSACLQPLKSRAVNFQDQGHIKPGAIVTDPRTATHMLVTEYGIANMKGKAPGKEQKHWSILPIEIP